MENMEILNALNYWHWIALAVTLGIADVLLGVNFVLVWCGLAALIVGILKWCIPSLAWQYQFLIFGIGVFGSLLFWRHYLKSRPQHSLAPHLNQRAKQYLNREFTLDAPIENGRGKVKVDDTTWRIQGKDLPAGAKIRVIDVAGVILIVEEIGSSNQNNK